MTTTKMFPIMIGYRGTKGPCPSSIPWDTIAPYEGMAKVNHDQTLERLAERGGLDPIEAFFVMTGRKWTAVPVGDELEKEACAFLDKIVKDPIRVERDALLLQVDELKAEIKKLHDGHGYKSGLGSCVCKWCAEKPKCGLHKPLGSGETCALASGHSGPCDYIEKRKCEVTIHNDVTENCVHKCGYDLPCPFHPVAEQGQPRI